MCTQRPCPGRLCKVSYPFSLSVPAYPSLLIRLCLSASSYQSLLISLFLSVSLQLFLVKKLACVDGAKYSYQNNHIGWIARYKA